MIHGAQVSWVFGLVLADVRGIDPLQTVHEKIVKGRAHVPHQAHKEERHLQNGMLDEVNAFNNIIVPSHALEIGEQAEEAYEDANTDGLFVLGSA